MKMVVDLFTQNRNYQNAKPLTPKGVIWHSTATPGAPYKNFKKSWDTPKFARGICVHAWVENTTVYQSMEYNKQAWGCGGSGNKTHIQFEIIEPADYDDKDYFAAVYKTALEYTAALLLKFKLPVDSVMDHAEAHQKGLASNHGDVAHWFSRHGKTMNDVRSDLRKMLTVPPAPSKPVAGTIKLGSKVKVNAGAKTYNGGGVAAFVYKGTYSVDSINKDRAVLDHKGICTAFNVKDLTLV